MANYPRSLIIFDGSIFHVTWKCHNNEWLLKSEFAKSLYYHLLLKYKDRYGVQIYSYCFMDNHPHITGHCQSQKLFSDFFRVVNSCFAKTLNRKLKRKGQAVMDRFKSQSLQSDDDLINVMIYNDLNPARTRKGLHPDKYAWSSYHHYAHGVENPLLTEPVWYKNLGPTPESRQQKYRHLISEIFQNDSRVPRCPYQSDTGRPLCYIGNPHWVEEQQRKLKESVRMARQYWRERFQQAYAAHLNQKRKQTHFMERRCSSNS